MKRLNLAKGANFILKGSWKNRTDYFLDFKNFKFFTQIIKENFDYSSKIAPLSTAKISLFAVVVDESQTVKNSERAPIENSMKNLWSLFSILSTDLLGTSENFLGPFMTGDNSIVQRALKRLVAADLPKLIEETVFVDMEQEEEERYFSFLHLLKEGRIIKSGTHSPQKERMQILEAITRLRQIVCHHELFSFQSTDKEMVSHSAKWELFFEEVQTLILDGKKVPILSHFSAIIDLIIDRAEKE
ncbi:hypothetical protein ACTFIW_005437 [Dictyostelium discoideum]